MLILIPTLYNYPILSKSKLDERLQFYLSVFMLTQRHETTAVDTIYVAGLFVFVLPHLHV